MSRKEPQEDPIITAGIATSLGGSAIFADPDMVPAPDDPNGPVPDNEETHDAAEEDDGLLDTGSPEFDHSLRRHHRPE